MSSFKIEFGYASTRYIYIKKNCFVRSNAMAFQSDQSETTLYIRVHANYSCVFALESKTNEGRRKE